MIAHSTFDALFVELSNPEISRREEQSLIFVARSDTCYFQIRSWGLSVTIYKWKACFIFAKSISEDSTIVDPRPGPLPEDSFWQTWSASSIFSVVSPCIVSDWNPSEMFSTWVSIVLQLATKSGTVQRSKGTMAKPLHEQRIAVIGSGISGLSMAWLLHKYVYD